MSYSELKEKLESPSDNFLSISLQNQPTNTKDTILFRRIKKERKTFANHSQQLSSNIRSHYIFRLKDSNTFCGTCPFGREEMLHFKMEIFSLV